MVAVGYARQQSSSSLLLNCQIQVLGWTRAVVQRSYTYDKRFDRVARTSCEDHLPYLGEGVIKVFHECSFLPTNFPVPAPKGQEINYDCVTLHLCSSQRFLIKIAIHTISRLHRNRTSFALTKARHRCTASLCTAHNIYFQPLNLPIQIQQKVIYWLVRETFITRYIYTISLSVVMALVHFYIIIIAFYVRINHQEK